MQCPFCKEEIREGAIKCKYCKSPLSNVFSPSQLSEITEESFICIEGLKSTNCPCLWVSLDYWNLYLGDKAFAVRCYRGKWGLIGFIIGLFFAFIGFVITGGLGLLLDRSQGEAKCTLLTDRINEIIQTRHKYKIIEGQLADINGPTSSDLCLGNIWLKYKLEFGGKAFYFEDSKYEQIKRRRVVVSALDS